MPDGACGLGCQEGCREDLGHDQEAQPHQKEQDSDASGQHAQSDFDPGGGKQGAHRRVPPAAFIIRLATSAPAFWF